MWTIVFCVSYLQSVLCVAGLFLLAAVTACLPSLRSWLAQGLSLVAMPFTCSYLLSSFRPTSLVRKYCTAYQRDGREKKAILPAVRHSSGPQIQTQRWPLSRSLHKHAARMIGLF